MANAFEIYAFDYLVKPFDLERIGKTLGRIKSLSSAKETEHAETKNEASYEKLVIRGKEEINLIDTKDILMIERTDGMCRIVTGEETLKKKKKKMIKMMRSMYFLKIQMKPRS